jgi:hypothetical protein
MGDSAGRRGGWKDNLRVKKIDTRNEQIHETECCPPFSNDLQKESSQQRTLSKMVRAMTI